MERDLLSVFQITNINTKFTAVSDPGFGLLEAGCVSIKNEVNIMVKNAVDVIFGGLTYWAFGYGLSFGEDELANPFCGVGYFMVDTNDPDLMGIVYSNFIFQVRVWSLYSVI